MQSSANHIRPASFTRGPGLAQLRKVETILTSKDTAPDQQAETSLGSSNSPTELIPYERVEALRNLTLKLLREVVALSEISEPAGSRGLSLATEVQRFEADIIRMALVQTAGKQRRAARLLGVKITTLHRKIKHYKINIEEIQKEATALRDAAQ
jgi:DNA-binding NtrC family response regulator